MAYTAQYRREYARRWHNARRAAYMDGKQCTECGSTQNLELDHIDPAQKVSHRIWSWSYARRMAEIAKCQVLCSDCHQEKTSRQTYGERQHGEPRTYLSGCRCNECTVGMRAYRRGLREAKKAARYAS